YPDRKGAPVRATLSAAGGVGVDPERAAARHALEHRRLESREKPRSRRRHFEPEPCRELREVFPRFPHLLCRNCEYREQHAAEQADHREWDHGLHRAVRSERESRVSRSGASPDPGKPLANGAVFVLLCRYAHVRTLYAE